MQSHSITNLNLDWILFAKSAYPTVDLGIAAAVNEFKGNQLPPPNTAFATYFGECGKPNEVRGKRSILKPPRRSRLQPQQGEDYVK